MSSSSYDWLIARLDAFIRKYYANQLLRGSLILLICLLFFVLAASVSEYYLYLPVAFRITIAGLFLSLGAAALVFWIALPLMRMARLGKVLSHEQAAVIVGRHFPEVSDKLLNILQLKNTEADASSRALVAASIEQKAAQISVVPLTGAVDLRRNRRFLPYLLPLLLVGLFILIAAPNVFRDASERLLQPTRVFEKPAPFKFVILNDQLQALRNADFPLRLEMKGSVLPAEVFIEIAGERIPMNASGSSRFQYIFRNLTEPVKFTFYAAGYHSGEYTLRIAQKPLMKAFRIVLDYPDYTGRKDETRTSLGDLLIPVGTKVSWGMNADYTDAAYIHWASGAAVQLPHNGNLFGYEHRFMSDTSYAISIHNKATRTSDSFAYHVQVIPDDHPTIQVQETRDTITGQHILLQGIAGDDYGLARVNFNYNIADATGRVIVNKTQQLRGAAGTLTPFQHYIDIQPLNLQPGQKLSYYIEAWDNDAVHGSKASRSEMMSFQMFTPKQLDSAINQNSQQINAGLSSSAQQNKQLQQELTEAQNRMLQSDNRTDFQQQQMLQEVAEKQEQLRQQMENTKKRFDEQIQQSRQKEYSEDVRQKQEKLQEQMDNLLNKELQEQMKKLQELMQQMNKEQSVQKMQQLQQQNKLFNMDVQRMQELMKQLEMQMRLEDLANKAQELAGKQLDLKQETDKNQKSAEALAREQKDLQKQLDSLMNRDMKAVQELNKGMKQGQQDLSGAQQQGKEAGSEMQQSSDELNQQQKGNSSQSQQKAAQKLQQMAQQLGKQAAGMDAEQIDLDIKATRQILSNLMRLSFEQESLMNSVRQTPASSPTYLANQTDQNRLHAASRTIRDSLFSLSKRVFQLSTTINKETTELEMNMGQTVTAIERRSTGEAITRQQYAMTHANNLALMLNELLSNLLQMQSQAMSMPGSGQGSKPGGKPKSGSGGAGQQLSDVITKQQSLGNAMQQMQNAMQRRGQGGSKPGEGQQGQQGQQGQGQGEGEGKGQGQGQGQGQGEGNKPGGQQGGNGSGSGGSGQSNGEGENGEYGDAQQLATLAAQQAALRRQIQDIQSRLNSRGLNAASRSLSEIQQQMDRNETDIVNRRITAEFMQRQREILSRMLEAEKAVRDQEQDDKRASNAGQDITRPVPAELDRFLKQRQQLLEMYRTVPPQLKPYYRGLVERYFRSIGSK